MQELNLKEIGSRLKSFRETNVGGQKSLSEECGISVKTLSLFENGHYAPSQQLISHLSIKYKLNPFWLTTGKGKEKDDSVEDPDAVHNLAAKVVSMEMQLAEMKVMMEKILNKLKD